MIVPLMSIQRSLHLATLFAVPNNMLSISPFFVFRINRRSPLMILNESIIYVIKKYIIVIDRRGHLCTILIQYLLYRRKVVLIRITHCVKCFRQVKKDNTCKFSFILHHFPYMICQVHTSDFCRSMTSKTKLVFRQKLVRL